ncbi:MAG: TetR/AcrR family transcriptional regulator [Hyphomonadaceae bacterium]|nr:TetR/AcrR family transcriptional regulator [Hyphomonadaceae bacterium]
MRYAKGHREETHARIVETASRLFREKGVDRVGVDEIMRESGLTHGGFYVHFRNKDQLIAEACALAVDERADEWKENLRGLPPEEAFAAFLDGYIECAGSGDCPFASLGADVARQGAEVREVYTEKVEELVEFMTEELSCGREEALLALVAVSGAINVANASNDPKFSKEIIATTRRNLVRLWVDRCGPKARAKQSVRKTRGKLAAAAAR